MNIRELESADYYGYVVSFSPNPSKFSRKNLKTLFNEGEISLLKASDPMAINVVIDFEETCIVKMHNGRASDIDPALIDKIVGILRDKLKVSAKKIVSSIKDHRFIVKSFFIVVK